MDEKMTQQALEFVRSLKGALDEAPTCPRCKRTDCGLLAASIVGLGNWVKAFRQCVIMSWRV